MPVTELSIDLSEKRRCFWCQKPGHLKRNCRMGVQGQCSAPPGRGGGNYDYQANWNAGELSSLVESQISTLTDGGAAAEQVNEMSTAFGGQILVNNSQHASASIKVSNLMENLAMQHVYSIQAIPLAQVWLYR